MAISEQKEQECINETWIKARKSTRNSCYNGDIKCGAIDKIKIEVEMRQHMTKGRWAREERSDIRVLPYLETVRFEQNNSRAKHTIIQIL